MNVHVSKIGVTTTASNTCPKCGIHKTSGKRSCCLRGGTWFNKCGNPGDAKFEHTWFDGMNACKSEFTSDRIVMCMYEKK